MARFPGAFYVPFLMKWPGQGSEHRCSASMGMRCPEMVEFISREHCIRVGRSLLFASGGENWAFVWEQCVVWKIIGVWSEGVVMKATAQEYALHQRVLARSDPVAFVELTEWLYLSLVQGVQQRAGRSADAILVEEAVGQALLDYHDAPARYDPGKAGLQRYLAMAAYRDYQNAQAKEQRLQAHQVSLFDPDLQEPAGDSEFVGPADIVAGREQAEALLHFIRELFHDPTERRIATLLIHEVRAIEPYAQVLGMSELPREEQVEHIQAVKYRIIRRLRRRVGQRLQQREGDTL